MIYSCSKALFACFCHILPFRYRARERSIFLLATIPSYIEAFKIFNDAAPSEELRIRAIHLAYVMRAFAGIRGHEELADEWASAGLLYHPSAEGLLSADVLKEAGANEGFIHLLSLKELPSMPAAPTISQELGCILPVAAALVHLITETMRAQNISPKDLKVSAIQKRFSDKSFKPEINRRLIHNGTQQLHWEIGNFTSKAIAAIRDNAAAIKADVKKQ